MNDEEPTTVRVATAVLLLVGAGALLLVPAASAQQTACDEVLDNRSNTSSGPGGQLADAIGDQREEIENSLEDTWLDARLANASSDRERAEILSQEVERIEERITTIERCWWGDRTERETVGNVADLDARQIDYLWNRTRLLHRQLNETRSEAARLSTSLREGYDIDDETLEELEERVVALRTSVNETA